MNEKIKNYLFFYISFWQDFNLVYNYLFALVLLFYNLIKKKKGLNINKKI